MIFAAFVAFLVVTALGGGGSRFDVQSVLFVRLAAVLFLAVVLLAGRDFRPSDNKGLLAFVLAAVAVVGVQLVPLPPDLWMKLPGRAIFAEGAVVAGIEQPWRPLTLAPGPTWNALVALLVPIAALIGARSLRSAHRTKLIWVIFGLIVLSGLLGMAQVTDGPGSPLRYYRVTNTDSSVGLLANRNHQAFLLLLGIPILFGFRRRLLARVAQPAVIDVTVFAASLFIITTVWMTGSRMGLVLSAVALVLSFVSFGWSLVLKRGKAAKAIAAVFVGLASLLALFLLTSRSMVRLWTQDPAEDLRVALFNDFMGMVREYFPFGSGFGSFPNIYPVFERVEMMGPRYVNHAHNDLIELLMEGGVPAILLLAVFLIWWTGAALRIFGFRGEEGGDVGAEAKIAVIATGLLLVASLTDYPLRTPLIAAIFAIYCAFMLPFPRRNGPSDAN